MILKFRELLEIHNHNATLQKRHKTISNTLMNKGSAFRNIGQKNTHTFDCLISLKKHLLGSCASFLLGSILANIFVHQNITLLCYFVSKFMWTVLRKQLRKSYYERFFLSENFVNFGLLDITNIEENSDQGGVEFFCVLVLANFPHNSGWWSD